MIKSIFEALRPTACPRDPFGLDFLEKVGVILKTAGSCGQAAGRRELNCKNVLIILILSAAVAIPVNAAPAFKKPEVVVLIHGLLRTTLSMLPLKLYLEHQGYEVKYYSYISARYSIHEHGMALRQYINQLETSNPNQKIHFVTHSLGGIILREALATHSTDQLKHIGYAVMLAPPNQGSELARFSTKAMPLFNYFVKPLPELSSDPKAYVHKVPLPKFKMGIIAGRYDAKVPPASAQLQGQKEVAIINATHTFIMVKPKTMKLVLHFLQNGNFA